MLNDDYIALIKNLISDFEKNNPKGHVTPHIRWETLKCVIGRETIKYCSLLKKTSNKEQSVLESKLEAMESNLLSCGPKQKEEILNNINLTQNDLNKLIEIKTKGAATRSRARWMESGEKNTKYFLHLEKWHLEKKSIKSLRSSFIHAYELMLGLHVFRQTRPPRRVDCLAPPSVCHIKTEASR